MSLLNILTVVFVLAKLGGFIDWSWWLVLAPLWVSMIVGGALFALIVWLNDKPRFRR